MEHVQPFLGTKLFSVRKAFLERGLSVKAINEGEDFIYVKTTSFVMGKALNGLVNDTGLEISSVDAVRKGVLQIVFEKV